MSPLQNGELMAQDQDFRGLHTSRRDSRSHAATRVIRRNTNRRHMTGDPHGRTAGKATLLIRAADEILGTHNSIPRCALKLPLSTITACLIVLDETVAAR